METKETQCKPFSIAVASTSSGVFGNKGKMPWPSLKEDLKHFSTLTKTAEAGKQNAVLMGRKTWVSLGKWKPLPGRINAILSEIMTQEESGPDARVFSNLSLALNELSKDKKVDKIFLIGGAKLVEQAMKLPECQTIWLTLVMGDFEGDTLLDLRFTTSGSGWKVTEKSELFQDSKSKINFQILKYTQEKEKEEEEALTGAQTK